MSKKFSPEELLGRWEDQREIKNLMGRLSQDYTLKEERSMYEKYWSKKRMSAWASTADGLQDRKM